MKELIGYVVTKKCKSAISGDEIILAESNTGLVYTTGYFDHLEEEEQHRRAADELVFKAETGQKVWLDRTEGLMFKKAKDSTLWVTDLALKI